jgi:hypothetical protein
MNIKLNARLRAYSKIDSLDECTHSFTYVTEGDIDNLFEDSDSLLQEEVSFSQGTVTFDDIDSLFGGR